MGRTGTGTAGDDGRKRVHEALIDLCCEGRFAATTVDELCRRAKVEPSFFDKQYGDLETCFLRSFEAEAERFHARLDPIRDGADPWRVRVRGVAYELIRAFKEDERITRFFVEARAGGERSLRFFGEEVDGWIDLIDEGRRQPGAPDGLTRSTADQITGAIFHQIYAAFPRGGLAPEGEIIPKLMYTVVLPYLGEEAALEELRIPPPE